MLGLVYAHTRYFSYLTASANFSDTRYYSTKFRMYLPIVIPTTSYFFFIIFLTFVHNGVTPAAEDRSKSIGAIIDVSSRIGKEEKISMEIAIQTFNDAAFNKNNLVLHAIEIPLQSSTAAENLVKEKQVEAIVGMKTWPQTALVAEATSKAQVPILSFATPSITSPLASTRWPFLIRMANNDSLQMQCVASIVSSYGWRRVIIVYEDDGYSSIDPGALTLLSDALHDVGSEIEHSLAFPSFSTLSNPKAFIQQELEKLSSQQSIASRVFIIVGASLEIASYIFTEARQMGLMGKDSVWITTDSVTNLLHSVNSSVISSMNGIIGIKTHFTDDDTSPSFLRFSAKFRNRFRSIYPEEDKSDPGIHALRAYDIISAVALAIEKSTNENTSTTTTRALLHNILTSNFSGLSGKIRFQDSELSSSTTYEIVNVAGKSYTVLKYWSPDNGFSNEAIGKMSSTQERNTSDSGGGGRNRRQVLGPRVYWPGGLDHRPPLGWVMPSDAKPLVIGVPGRTSFEKFVKVTKDGQDPTGFCIDVFKKAANLLNYDLPPHKFEPFNGSYDELVDQVYLKRFGAVVGDITILANRSKYVEFTQPYAESGLTMVVPVKIEDKAWLFVKPFTKTLWLAVSGVFVYTMFVVWFLEHRSNPDFRGPWKNQLSTAMWFIFSTLFFAHRERLESIYTRVVMFIWLFTVFVVTSSYTASLTSMLTVQRLEPTATDIDALRRSNSPIGCDGDSFVRKYIQDVFKFDQKNIIDIGSQYDYPAAFKNGTIKAAILELPYERVFLSINSKDYQDTGLGHRFGGLGFVFPKGSPMARDFSEAFLKLSEDGTLNKLDQDWFKTSSELSNSNDSINNQSLSVSDFRGLFLVTGLTSTLMLILYIIHLYTNFRSRSIQSTNNEDSVWIGIKRLGRYYDNARRHLSRRDPSTTQARDGHGEISLSSTGEYLSEYNTPRHPYSTRVTETEMQERCIGDLDNQTRALRLSYSFPVWNRPVHGFNHVNP